MADVKINLEATHKEFLASITAASKATTTLLDQLQKMSTAHTQVGAAATKQAAATNSATAATTQNTRATQQNAGSMQTLGSAIGKTVTGYLLLFEAAKKVGQALSGTFSAAITNIDDFKKQTIGTAAAITNIRDETQTVGQTWSQVFEQNLKSTIGTFLELERLSARYFSSSIDLQLAYNAFAQRGIIIRRSELEQLAQLTDLILLLTQGQQSTIQVQEEIRSLINGTLRPTAQLGQLLKSYGKDIKEVGAEIRATQSLKPLEGVLRGAAQATHEIQTTYQAIVNGFDVAIRQIGRIGGEQFFSQITGVIQRFTTFLNANRERISGLFAGVGAVVGKALEQVEQFVEQLLSSNSAAGAAAGPFIRFAAVIEAVALTLFETVKVIGLLIRDIPLLIDALVTGLNEVAPASERAFSPTKAIISGLKAIASSIIPGLSLATDKTGGLHKALAIIQADFASIGKSDPFANINKRVEQLTGIVNRAAANAKKLFETGAGDAPSPTSIAFKATAEENAEVKKLSATLNAAKIQAARADRLAALIDVSTSIDLDLQQARRSFALIEQGFRVSGDSIVEFRSELQGVASFIQDNFVGLAKGEVEDFSRLAGSVLRVNQDIATSLFANLNLQYQIALKGLEQFKQEAQVKADEVAAVEVAPIQAQALNARNDAEERYTALLATNQAFVADAEAALAKAKTGQDSLNILREEANVTQSRAIALSGQVYAEDRRTSELRKADLLDLLAIENQSRIDAKRDASVAVARRTIESDRFRILQQINFESEKLFQTNVKIAGIVAQQNKDVAEASPRTPLQTALSGIAAVRMVLSQEFARAQAQFTTLIAQLERDISGGDTGKTQQLDEVLAQKRTTDELIKLSDTAIKSAVSLAYLQNAIESIQGAVQGTADLLISGLTQAFEGKSTDFLRGFKSIADSLFKDSLKNFVDSMKTSVSSAFQKLAQSIPGEMGNTLGPAFLAGFALIASFVLGQLLSGGSSGSAGNPQVGIQSTEQVRGLIGGETQIPIGMIGESLQDALVPTNLLLSRIAAGVDRLSFGGIDPSVIESTISQSISDALQIQLSAT